MFGLQQEQLARLAEAVDVIYHNGYIHTRTFSTHALCLCLSFGLLPILLERKSTLFFHTLSSVDRTSSVPQLFVVISNATTIFDSD
jgi:hypothetical protein